MKTSFLFLITCFLLRVGIHLQSDAYLTLHCNQVVKVGRKTYKRPRLQPVNGRLGRIPGSLSSAWPGLYWLLDKAGEAIESRENEGWVLFCGEHKG